MLPHLYPVQLLHPLRSTPIAPVGFYPRAISDFKSGSIRGPSAISGSLLSQASSSSSPTARTLLHNIGQTRPSKGVEGSFGHGSGGDGQHCASRVRPEGDGKSTRHPQRCDRQRRREERRSRVTTSLGEACSSNTAVGIKKDSDVDRQRA